jgi:hypothetical protein
MKFASVLLGSVMIFGAAISTSQAEICWRLSPFGDTVRVAETSFSDEAVGNIAGIFNNARASFTLISCDTLSTLAREGGAAVGF